MGLVPLEQESRWTMEALERLEGLMMWSRGMIPPESPDRLLRLSFRIPWEYHGCFRIATPNCRSHRFGPHCVRGLPSVPNDDLALVHRRWA